jgi:hypothetical protein
MPGVYLQSQIQESSTTLQSTGAQVDGMEDCGFESDTSFAMKVPGLESFAIRIN